MGFSVATDGGIGGVIRLGQPRQPHARPRADHRGHGGVRRRHRRQPGGDADDHPQPDRHQQRDAGPRDHERHRRRDLRLRHRHDHANTDDPRRSRRTPRTRAPGSCSPATRRTRSRSPATRSRTTRTGQNLLANGVSKADGSSVTITDSILSANNADSGNWNCDIKPTSGGGNIDGGSLCGFTTSARQAEHRSACLPTTLPALTSGETQTLPITTASPAFDFAGACTQADQRDFARPQGAACDSGAYELDWPPDTTITSGPGTATNDTTPTFAFTSTEAGSTFRCQPRRPGPRRCSVAVSRTADARRRHAHVQRVRAIDPAGMPDPTAATLQLHGRHDGAGHDADADHDADQQQQADVQLQLDRDRLRRSPARSTRRRCGACTSPYTLATALADGSHTFSVFATDAAGNADPTPASQTFVVDTTPPDTTITSQPEQPDERHHGDVHL